jgi:L-fucose mutarotase
MPLKGVPKVLSPQLLQILSCMGHGDEIVLADAHFPSSSIANSSTCNTIELRLDACQSISLLLKSILKFFPLDQYAEDSSVMLMDLVDSDKEKNLVVQAWNEYQELVDEAEKKRVKMKFLERFEFYERAKKTYAIVHTGCVFLLALLYSTLFQFQFFFFLFSSDVAIYANIILKKGVVIE